MKVPSGVAQGSVLGPQLFLFLVHSLAEVSLPKFCELFLFADDCMILMPIFKENDYAVAQKAVDTVAQWCSDNLLELNSDKCKTMVFSYSNRPPPPPG